MDFIPQIYLYVVTMGTKIIYTNKSTFTCEYQGTFFLLLKCCENIMHKTTDFYRSRIQSNAVKEYNSLSPNWHQKPSSNAECPSNNYEQKQYEVSQVYPFNHIARWQNEM